MLIAKESMRVKLNSGKAVTGETSRSLFKSNIPTLMDKWATTDNIAGQMSDGFANGLFSVGQFFTSSLQDNTYNLDGTIQEKGSNEMFDNFTGGAMTFVPVGAGKAAMGSM